MDHWRLIVAIAIHALTATSVVYLCAPANRARVGAWQVFVAGMSGLILGFWFIGLPYLFPGDKMDPFPFDPNQAGSNAFATMVFFENVAVGVGVPFIFLALWVLASRRPRAQT